MTGAEGWQESDGEFVEAMMSQMTLKSLQSNKNTERDSRPNMLRGNLVAEVSVKFKEASTSFWLICLLNTLQKLLVRVIFERLMKCTCRLSKIQ